MSTQSKSPAQAVAIIAVLTATLGCGPDGPRKYSVTGEVTFDGEPIPDGYITFAPAERGETPVAGPIADGKFSLEATAGEKRVEVQASMFVGPENPVMGLRPREQYIPDRYNVESELTETVTPDGPNEFKFELTSTQPADGE